MKATQSLPFVLYSEDGPGQAVIDGKGNFENMIQISGQYVIIDGLEVTDCSGYGIAVFRTSSFIGQGGEDSYCVIRNCIVHKTGRDAVKSALINFLLIENNEIYNVTNSGQDDDLIDGVGVYHSICRFNYLHDNSRGTGGYFKGGSANNIWYNNLFKDIGGSDETALVTGRASGLQLGGSGQFSWRDMEWFNYPAGYEQLAFNNVFINCQGSAINIKSCWKARIYNNAMYNCGYRTDMPQTPAVIRVTVSDNQGSDQIDIFNNVSYNSSGYKVESFFAEGDYKNKTGVVYHGFNSAYNESGTMAWGYDDEEDNTELFENPLFMNPENNDLSLQAGSPAIDAGEINVFVLFDYLLKPRPIGNSIDRGAYEQ